MTVEDWFEAVRRTAHGRMPDGRPSPYKPLLLLATLRRLEQGKLPLPEVRLDEGMRSLYDSLLDQAFPRWSWDRDPRQPFRHLAPTVWQLRPRGEHEARLEALLGAGSAAPWKAVASATDCALLPTEVHERLCADDTLRARLEALLLGQLAESRGDANAAGMALSARPRSTGAAPSGSRDRAAVSRDEVLLESALEDWLVTHWESNALARMGVAIHTNARREPVGRQFPAERWNIDVLGWQERERCWWVIELKRGRADDEVVGQVGRYMGWVEKYLSRPGEQLRGAVVARSVSRALELACYANPRVSAWTFDNSFALHPA